MSMERATVLEEREKLQKSEPELVWGWRLRGKKAVRLGPREQKSEPKEIDFSKYDQSPQPYMYKHYDFEYKNEAWKKSEAIIQDYNNCSRGLSPYDAIAPPQTSNPVLDILGGIVPHPIDDETLIPLSHLALNDYNQRLQAPTFLFHRLVKCCSCCGMLSDYYITFEAKTTEEQEDAITTFQAHVSETENASYEVIECKIKI